MSGLLALRHCPQEVPKTSWRRSRRANSASDLSAIAVQHPGPALEAVHTCFQGEISKFFIQNRCLKWLLAPLPQPMKGTQVLPKGPLLLVPPQRIFCTWPRLQSRLSSLASSHFFGPSPKLRGSQLRPARSSMSSSFRLGAWIPET